MWHMCNENRINTFMGTEWCFILLFNLERRLFFCTSLFFIWQKVICRFPIWPYFFLKEFLQQGFYGLLRMFYWHGKEFNCPPMPHPFKTRFFLLLFVLETKIKSHNFQDVFIEYVKEKNLSRETIWKRWGEGGHAVVKKS